MRKPGLTVTVIVLVGGAALQRCIERFRTMPVAIVVVGTLPGPAQTALRAQGIDVIDSSDTVPRRRAIGAARACTEWIAFCEDTCEAGASWFAAFTQASAVPRADLWSGPIELDANLPARCLALAALEYGEFGAHRWQRLAQPGGTPWRLTRRLAGLCFMVRASALPPTVPVHGLIETELQRTVQAAGGAIALHPDLAVTYFAADAAAARARTRMQHGRVYGGGLRAQLLRRLPRLFALAKCLALPAVLWARGAASLPRGRRWDPAVHAGLLALACGWSLGEALGLAAGRGKSLEAWR